MTSLKRFMRRKTKFKTLHFYLPVNNQFSCILSAQIMSLEFGDHVWLQFSNIGEHGWTNSGSIVWTEDILPENIDDILMNEDENDNESEVEDDSEGESEDD